MTHSPPLALTRPIPHPGTGGEERSDEAVVRAILDGRSEAAFRDLYARHTPRLYRIARRVAAGDADADDIVQETWLRVVQRLGSFEGRSALGTWVTGIFINVMREQLQRRGRWRMVELPDTVADGFRMPDGDIEEAIGALPLGARVAFVLHDIEGFTHEEIAAQMGWVAGTSKTQLFRARRALRALLRPEGKDGIR